VTRGVHTVMLTTVDTDGALHSRPMGGQELDEEGMLLFITEAAADKVER
jgi:general stress protein 26